jgi:hypothetical protein
MAKKTSGTKKASASKARRGSSQNTVRLPPALIAAVDKWAKAKRCNRTTAVRQLLTLGLAENGD